MILKLNVTPRQFGDAAAEAFAQGFDVTAWLYNMTCKSIAAEQEASCEPSKEQEPATISTPTPATTDETH